MLVWKSLSVRTAATISTPLFRAHAPTAVLHIKGLTAANVVFPPPEAIKEFEMSFAGTMVRSPTVARGLTATAAKAVTAKAAAV
ncbi:uncharacterized protein H6S33_010630 [Morchella sextelata]|uniref:uncharacterized protein n=1 Tax=Morchella sextelata TaxID=1174677 RepID=UPI001D037AC5|nr:uncharacterized protein H6S33_010630 [Morchella sextelata]KAH0611365.1 hypothetical protein H6S33_010630 [Morchella sextelata]